MFVFLVSIQKGFLIQVLIKNQMHFVYLRVCVPLQSMAKIFFSLVLFSDEMHKRREKRLKGTIPILRKICYPFSPFLFINIPTQIKIFLYSIYPLFLMNHIFSWKSKLKHTNVDITYFFQYAKCFFTDKTSKHQKRLMESVKHLNWSFL